VNNIMNDFVGNILQNRFAPAVTSCITYTPTYTYLRRCYAILIGATGAGTSLLLTAYCI